MPSYPSVKQDTVLYDLTKIFADQNIVITLLDGSQLEIWGNFFVNGNPIVNIGALPIATQAEAEAGTDNTKVMTPLRVKQAVIVQAFPAVVSGSGGGTLNFLRADGTWAAPPAGGGLTDGDKGDITVTAGVWTIDTGVVSNAKISPMNALSLKGNSTAGAAQPTDMTVAQVKTMLALTKTDVGLGNVDNTSDANAPVSTAQATAIGLKADKTITISTTAPITGGGDLSASRTLDISTFTAAVKGAVPPPITATGKFLKDDATWAVPAGGGGGLIDGDMGDITVGGSGTTLTVDAGAVTLAKMANLSQDQFIGRVTASTGVPETATITAAARTVLDDATTAAMLTTLGGVADTATIDVSHGGTGKTSFTSNRLIAGGTTSTGPLVSMAGGTTGFVLTSGAALPTWTDLSVVYSPLRYTSISTVSAATYTIVLADEPKLLQFTSATAVTLSVPTNATTAFPVGCYIDFYQDGAGKVSIVAVTPGTTTIKATPAAGLRAQYSAATLVKLATDVWLLTGDLA